MVQQDKLGVAENSITRGLTFLRKGVYDEVSGNSRKAVRNPADVFGAATNQYVTAYKALNESKPDKDALQPVIDRYDKAMADLDHLKTELIDYAKEAANKIGQRSILYVSGVEKLVVQEERGRKILGVPYARRPKAAKVKDAIDNARGQIGNIVITTEVKENGHEVGSGKSYILHLRGDLASIRNNLKRAALLGDPEEKYITGVEGDVAQDMKSIDDLDKYHRNLLSERFKAEQKKAEDKRLAKLEKERQRDLRKNLKELRKRKW
ncbi:MAG: hypothetical protein HYT71_01290 [Candidatus Aenigmarchaeota archaeon]|nr:hypothetical protein [Candidatus Aenigmarchaeota archaeon]